MAIMKFITFFCLLPSHNFFDQWIGKELILEFNHFII